MTQLCNITREWEGLTCAILASGPSMTREVAETVRASGVRTIAVNNQAIVTHGKPALAPWADILYAADARWWHNNNAAIAQFMGRKITISSAGDRIPNLISPDILVVGHGGVNGFDERTTHIRSGSNSGYQAIHLAIHMGARRVVLCGFDMHARNGEHWFGDHHWRRGYRSRYDLFLYSFRAAAPAFLARAEVVNATPGSALKCFPFLSLEEALNGVPVVCKGQTQTSTAAEAPARKAGEATGAAA